MTTAENYQLKWHSFSSYLHSCVSSYISEQTFADVSLCTIDGYNIMAHRFILSACSQYLNQVFKMQPKITSSLPFVIVLPSEINHKTLKTLVQYMYSGETTVSNDILENVLRGGDILKIKGLWRPKEDEQFDKKLVKLHQKYRESHKSIDLQKHRMKEQNQKSDSDNIKQSRQTKTLESKNISMTTNERPKDKNLNNEVHGKSQTNDTIINEKSQTKDNVINGKSQTNDNITNGKSQTDNNITNGKSQTDDNVINEKSQTTDNVINGKSQTDDNVIKGKSQTDKVQEKNEVDITEELTGNNQYLMIKEEPVEWNETNEADMELIDENEIFQPEMTIKPEVLLDTSNEQNEELYSPLTCELCTETFTYPADWVKHIQTHTDMLPAKRQRSGRQSVGEDATFPPLHCDLCRKYFPTPAEWVHHIQNTHTEFELRLYNKTSSKPIRVNKHVGAAHKICIVCNKTFPSHASMLIHRRTHTGEKPYMCKYCSKGFNVKSNLLRHLRTLHDKIINSTEIEPKEEISKYIIHM